MRDDAEEQKCAEQPAAPIDGADLQSLHEPGSDALLSQEARERIEQAIRRKEAEQAAIEDEEEAQ